MYDAQAGPEARRATVRSGIPALAACICASLVLAVPGPVARAQPSLDSMIRQVKQGGCPAALPVLEQLSNGTDLEAKRAAYLTGWCLSRTGRHADAAAAFRAAASHPTLRLYAQAGEGSELLHSGNASEAAALLRTVAATAPARLRARALIALGDAEIEMGHSPQAEAALQQAAGLQPDDPSVWLQLGGAAMAAGHAELARRAYGRAAWAFPGDPVEVRAREAIAKVLGRPVGARDIDAASRLQRARRLSEQGVWDQAATELRAVTAAVRTGPIAGETWYRLGEIYLFSDQRAAYDAFRRAAGLGWNVPGAWYWTAATARRLGLASQARDATAALLRVEPAGFWTGRFWLDAGLRAESDGRSADAASAYHRAAAAAPATDDGAEARWRLGWIALRAGRFADAEARFRAAAAEAVWRSDAARAWYWVAKTIEARTGRPGGGEAAALIRMVAERYPFTFYGQRAQARIGSPPPALPPSPLNVLPREAAAPAYQELARLGSDADAAEAAEDALAIRGSAQGSAPASRDPQIVRFLAETYNRLGDVRQSVADAEEALAAGVRDETMWRVAYPRVYWSEVTAAAQAANIDPLFLLAVVREESRYDASVISPARAVGLAQMLPGTAQAMAGDASIGVQRLKDPSLNLRLGARYLRLQLDRFGGDLRLTLAAYNAGPGAAQRWVNLDPDPDYVVEKIGFSETRAYVRRVLGSYGIYKLLW